MAELCTPVRSVADRFRDRFDRPPEVRAVAPGRVNLIGEHTDYNEGFVMPAAIGLETRIAYVPVDDRRVELMLAATGERAAFELDRIGPRRRAWIDYVAGVAWALGEAGVPTHGLRGIVASTLPMNAGLSSSAALELASAWALTGDGPPPVDRVTLARICQRAENEYVGVASGLMDQFASSVGGAGAAILLDCRSLEHRAVPLPAECILVVCHTGSERRLEASAYNRRRAECERAVATIARRHPWVRSLRDVDRELLESVRDDLDPVAYRRAEHVVTENERVLATEAALRGGDLAAVGRLWAESHASLRDRYEVSSPELDALVEIAAATPGVVAARLTGAGFGGCTVNLVRRDAVGRLRAIVAQDYPRRIGRTPRIWEVEPVGGAGPVEA
ncbi:MAG TPA: galactokinase [bacterium]|nr:galactokinase [bacterium]